MLASFHGDTNGLATIPVVQAVHAVWSMLDTEHRCAAPARPPLILTIIPRHVPHLAVWRAETFPDPRGPKWSVPACVRRAHNQSCVVSRTPPLAYASLQHSPVAASLGNPRGPHPNTSVRPWTRTRWMQAGVRPRREHLRHGDPRQGPGEQSGPLIGRAVAAPRPPLPADTPPPPSALCEQACDAACTRAINWPRGEGPGSPTPPVAAPSSAALPAHFLRGPRARRAYHNSCFAGRYRRIVSSTRTPRMRTRRSARCTPSPKKERVALVGGDGHCVSTHSLRKCVT